MLFFVACLTGLIGFILAIKLTLLWQGLVILAFILIGRSRYVDRMEIGGLVVIFPMAWCVVGMILGNIYFLIEYGGQYNIPGMIRWLFTP